MIVKNGQTGIKAKFNRWLVSPGGRLRHSFEPATASQPDSRIETLLETGYIVSSDAELTLLMERVLRAALHDTGATVGYVMTPDAGRTQLMMRTAVCLGEPLPLPATRGLTDNGLTNTTEAEVFMSGKPLTVTKERPAKGSADRNAALPTNCDLRSGEAMLCVPLLTRENGDNGDMHRQGVLALRHVRGDADFSPADSRLARQAAGLIAGALAYAQACVERKLTMIATLQHLVISLENKDPHTVNHSHRVTEVCCMLAEQIHLDAQTLENLRTGAMLHDIGKIGIPSGVLNKPGNLTEEELTLLKQYPIVGYNMCQPLDLGDEILLLIRNHAEKLDGTGYPDRLRQGQLPVPLRILCVADAFDAMSSYRPYRKAMDERERREQLNRFAGTQFDPAVVEALKRLLDDGRLNELYRDQWQLSAEMHSRNEQSQKAA